MDSHSRDSVFETELETDEYGDTIIHIPRDVYERNHGFFKEDGNTRWRIKVTIEKLE